MNLNLINEAISQVHDEITKINFNKVNWQNYTEQDFIREAAICICSSQMRYEVALAAGNRIANLNSIKNGNFYSSNDCLFEIQSVFTEPLTVNIEGIQRIIYPRFKNRIIY